MLTANNSFAGIRSAVVEQAAETISRVFGREVVEEFGETGTAIVARKLESLAAKHGEELVTDAAKKIGPRMFRIVEEVGEDGTFKALKLMSRRGDEAVWVVSKPGRLSLFMKYGDDAADAMIKHREISEAIVSQYGGAGAKAMSTVGGRSARRIAMMSDSGDLARMADATGTLRVIGKYGDTAADWIWRHKGALAVSAIAVAFVSDPEPFLSGATEVVCLGPKYFVGPVAEIAAKSINWNLWVSITTAVMLCLLAFKFGGRLLARNSHAVASGS